MNTNMEYKYPDDRRYWVAVEAWAKHLKSDGCSGPTIQVFVRGCWEHDIAYRTHKDIILAEAEYEGLQIAGYRLSDYEITRKYADDRFKERIKQRSIFDGISPMAHWRWFALRMFGGSSWEHDSKGTPLTEHPNIYLWRCDQS